MPMRTAKPKSNNTTDFTSPYPDPQDNGTLQTGGWASNPGNEGVVSGAEPVEVYEALPANVRVQLSGVTPIGPNQYSTTLSLSGVNTLQLVPNAADAHQTPTTAVAPNALSWSFISRNTKVATVDSGGLVTAVGRGQCEVRVISSRTVNASIVGATPSGTEGVDATIQITVLA